MTTQELNNLEEKAFATLDKIAAGRSTLQVANVSMQIEAADKILAHVRELRIQGQWEGN